MATWQHWVNFLLGVWLIISAYVVDVSNMFTNLWIVGAVIAVLALWGGLQEGVERNRMHDRARHHA